MSGKEAVLWLWQMFQLMILQVILASVWYYGGGSAACLGGYISASVAVGFTALSLN